MDARKSARISRDMREGGGEAGGATEITMDLTEFLAEAELSHYLPALRNQLKVTCVEHLKYVKEEDLEGIGMTRPEMRRLKKFYKKEHPQGTFAKMKKAILRTGGGDGGRAVSPPASEHRVSRPVSLVRPGRTLIPAENVVLGAPLGEGTLGPVKQAVWTADTGEKVPVTVKCVGRDRLRHSVDEVVKGASLLQTLDHDNITMLYGVVSPATEGALMLVCQLCPLGSLHTALKQPSSPGDYPLPTLCDFAQQLCDALSYLESKRLVHRRLSCSNVLLFSKSKIKLSDSGVWDLLGADADDYLGGAGVAWCAPEVLTDLHFSSASDVWAFGVTLWEMFSYSRQQPWAGYAPQQIMDAVVGGQLMEQPELCPKEFYSLLRQCWCVSPERRPTFSQLFLTLPQIRPFQVKAVKDGPSGERDMLHYNNYDIIIVLDKSPRDAPSGGLWRGCVRGKSGFFNPVHTQAYVEPKMSPISLPKTSLTRKESGRSSKRSSKLRADMIGAPQNDLRHTGHIGYDGAVFGDVSFIGDNYDKLPLKVGASGKVDVSRGSSLGSIPRNTDSPDRNGFVKTSTSDDSLDRRNTYGHSWISQESLASTQADDHHDGYQDIDDNSIFADFKMPDLGSSFDFGPSFMDEVLKALDEKEKQAEAATAGSGSTFNGCDVDSNRVSLDALTPVGDDHTPLCEEKGFASSQPSAPQRASPPPLPTNPPRTDSSGLRGEKKQAKVKPMSASEEKMMEDAITLANEVTATRAQRTSQSQSPPPSPQPQDSKAHPLDLTDGASNDSSAAPPSLMCKLKNSMRRSPKGERKRTFSDDRPVKGDAEEDIPAGAQEAYNALVVRGAGDSRPHHPPPPPHHHHHHHHHHDEDVFVPDVSEAQAAPEARLPPPSFSSSSSSSTTSPRGLPQPPPRPMPKPRMEPAAPPPPVAKKSDMPVPKPRPEIIQRVEPIRRPPDSPEAPLKEKEAQPWLVGGKDSSHIPVPASSSSSSSSSRKESWSGSKEREREQLKRTIEIVRVVDSPGRGEDLPDTKESTPEQSDSDTSARQSSASESGVGGGSESAKVMSLFDEDFSEPSPREIMSKLARDSRLRRNMDNRSVSMDSSDQQPHTSTITTSITSTTRTSKREPSGIPTKLPSSSSSSLSSSSLPPPSSTSDDAAATPAAGRGGGEEEEEVDTNPLRMLRGGALPIRAGRGGASGRRTGKR